jgi:hypothetical protein
MRAVLAVIVMGSPFPRTDIRPLLGNMRRAFSNDKLMIEP